MTDTSDTTKALADDQARRPEQQAPDSNAPTVVLGSPGAAIYGGYILESESDARLSRAQKYTTYSNILANVPIVAAGVRFFLNLVAKAEWKVQPPEDGGARGEELAATVEDILNDMDTPWHRIVRRAAMYRFYGFGIQEWTAKRRGDGVVGFLDVEPRPQITCERWDTNANGDVLGVLQKNPQTQMENYLPREKVVYLVDDSLNDSPEGLGLFRHLVEPAARLRRYEQLEGFGYENDLRGTPLLRAPLTELAKMVKNGTITATQRDALLSPLQDFITNHVKNPALGLLLDSQTWRTTDERSTPSNVAQFDAQLMDGGEYNLDAVANAIQRVMTDMARVLGIEHLMLGGGDGGSWALSRDKSDNFALIVDSTLKELREAFEADLLRPLWLLNGWPDDLMPTLVTDTSASRDVEQIAGAVRDLAAAGVVLDRDDEAVAELFHLLGLSRLVGSVADPDMDLSGSAGENDETPDREQREGGGSAADSQGAETPERDQEGDD